uniref:DB domain-containing protein n=1 Tax=Steinernema glaseri TaxID=37863 RepID=A0A1I7ZGQ8_9BILA
MVSPAVLVAAVVVALTVFPDHADTCAANGVCGASPACYQAQPAVGCGGGCGPRYGCGNYGCYRMRARAAHNFQPGRTHSRNTPMLRAVDELRYQRTDGGSQPMRELDDLTAASPSVAALRRSSVAFSNPNEAFLNCCMDRKLPDACLRHCNFQGYSKETLTAMYFKTDACPIQAMSEIQFCAAQGRDHRACCARNGLTTTLAGSKCLTFCDQRPGRVTQLDTSYISCFDRFESMKACFWHDITRYFRH